MKNCTWWNSCKQLRLSENERLKRYGVNEANTRLATCLMEIGNGTFPVVRQGEVLAGCIQIPNEYIFGSDNIDAFVNWAYPTLADGTVNSSSSITTPLNRDVDNLNSKCLEK